MSYIETKEDKEEQMVLMLKLMSNKPASPNGSNASKKWIILKLVIQKSVPFLQLGLVDQVRWSDHLVAGALNGLAPNTQFCLACRLRTQDFSAFLRVREIHPVFLKKEVLAAWKSLANRHLTALVFLLCLWTFDAGWVLAWIIWVQALFNYLLVLHRRRGIKFSCSTVHNGHVRKDVLRTKKHATTI